MAGKYFCREGNLDGIDLVFFLVVHENHTVDIQPTTILHLFFGVISLGYQLTLSERLLFEYIFFQRTMYAAGKNGNIMSSSRG